MYPHGDAGRTDFQKSGDLGKGVSFVIVKIDDDSVEDLVQTVFLKLIDGKALPKPGSERAFLIRITVNCCKDQLRSVWLSHNLLLFHGRYPPLCF